MVKKLSTNERRKQRVRAHLRKVMNGRPRLSVFRSSKHIYAQVIDDTKGLTLVSASSMEKEFSNDKGGNKDAANIVGKLIGERALKLGVRDVIFDRGSYLYHGRVQALAEAARETGLKF